MICSRRSMIAGTDRSIGQSKARGKEVRHGPHLLACLFKVPAPGASGGDAVAKDWTTRAVMPV